MTNITAASNVNNQNSATTTTAGTSAQTSDSSSNAGTIGLANNFSTFLTLLTTQLRNQDPLEPTDSSEFTNQLVQFAGVEQQIKQSGQLETLLERVGQSTSLSLVNYINRSVEYTGDQGNLEVGGSLKFTYDLPENSTGTTINVFNDTGERVGQITGETSEGQHTYDWNGTITTGSKTQTFPPGLYRFQVSARNASNETINNIDYTVFGRATGVNTTSGSEKVLFGNLNVNVEDVVSVSEAAARTSS